MSEDKNKRGKVVFVVGVVGDVFDKMHINNAFPEGVVSLSCVKSNLQKSKIIIDFDKKKIIFSECFYEYAKDPSHVVYLNHIYDLDKVNLDVFLECIIRESYIKLSNIAFENVIKKIIKNDYLRERFYKVLENSPDLKQLIKERLLIWER